MNQVPFATFLRAIRDRYGCTATYLHPVMVNEILEGRPVQTEVLVFLLRDHPTAGECFAWELDGHVTAVLREGPVRSARDAVKVSITAR